MQSILSSIKAFLSKGVVKGALVLCISALICKFIGIFYRIPLTNIIGAEGIGLYQLVFPIYSLLLILSSNALPVAISKIVSQKIKEQDFSYVAKLKKVAINFFGLFGFVLTVLLMLFAKQISSLQGNESAFIGYIAIAPSVFLVSILSVYRGIFQGFKDMKPTGYSQVIEQVVKLVLGLFLPIYFSSYGLAFQVGMALVGVTISEFIALIYIIVLFYFFKKTKIKTNIISLNNAKYKDILKVLLKTTFPIMLANCIIPLCVVIESFLIINGLVYVGYNILYATQVYGVYSGVVTTLINVPIVLASSIGVALVPHISAENKSNDVTVNTSKDNKEKSSALYQSFNNCVKLGLIIAIPSALFFCFFSFFIIRLLYPTLEFELQNLSALLLIFSSINIVSLSFTYICSSYLQALGNLYEPVICMSIMNFLRLIISFIALIKFGILSFIAFSAFVYICQMMTLVSSIKKKIE